jgi:hypothetical protein
MNKLVKLAIVLTVMCTITTSCVSVKQYQKMYLNDADMALSAKKLESFEINFESYREGAAGANGGKVGGGCGCN